MRAVLLALCLSGFLALGGCNDRQAAEGSATVAASNQAEASDDYVVSPVEVKIESLVAEYAKNEAAAQHKYEGRWIAVSGRVRMIDLDFSDKPVVRFDGDVMPSPTARFNEHYERDADELAKGQDVTLVCSKVREVMGSPSLDNCRLLRKDMVVAGAPANAGTQ